MIIVFTSSENQATIPINETVTFVVRIVFAGPFDPDLLNKQSQAFRNLRSILLEFLIPLYRNKRGFLGIVFISFSPGSVVADIEILYNSSEPIPTVEEVRSPIAEARDNGSAPFSIESLRVTKKGDSQDAFETWKIGVIVCLGSVLLLLIFFSVAVSISFTLGKLNSDSNKMSCL